MTDPRDLPGAVRLSEAEVQQVIERALKIDAVRQHETTVADLQRVAEELGLSPTSITLAVEQLRAEAAVASRAPVSLTWKEQVQDGLPTVVMGVMAFWLGVAIGGKREDINFYLWVISILAAVAYRSHGKERRYFRDLAMVWAGFGLGWFLSGGTPSDGDTLFHLTVPGATAAVLGWIVLKARWPWRKRAVTTETP